MSPRHLQDGDLIRILDREESPAGAVEHIASCTVCRRRLDSLRRQGEHVRAVIDALEIAPPRYGRDFLDKLAVNPPASRAPGPVRSWWIAAAAVLALLFVAPGVWAWLSENIAWVQESRTEQELPEGQGPLAIEGAPVEVSVPMDIARLIIELDDPAAGSQIVVRRITGTRATARLLRSEVSGELVVLPHGFRVISTNDTGEIRLEVEVPSSVITVEARVGERTPQEQLVRELPEDGWRVEVGGG